MLHPSAPRSSGAAEAIKGALTNVWGLVEALGLNQAAKRQQGGRGALICCPAHNERNPSCSVTLGPDGTIRVRCFACDFSGDALSLIAAAHGLRTRGDDYRRVLALGASLAGVFVEGLAPSDGPPPLRQRDAEPTPPPGVEEATFGNAARILLEGCPLADTLEFGMVSRGILFDAQRDGWGALPATYAGPEQPTGDEASSDVREPLRGLFAAESLRWLLQGRRWLWAEHRLLIPWRRPEGSVWGLQRRYAPQYGTEAPKGAPKYVWPRESDYAPARRYAYGVDHPRLRDARELWIAEGAVDVLALRALNRNARSPRAMAALGIPGASSWGKFRASVIPSVRGRIVHVSLDADRAGEDAVGRIARDVQEAGAYLVKRTRPTRGKDWADEAARAFWSEETPEARRERQARERSEAHGA
jgi:hypothetical protein